MHCDVLNHDVYHVGCCLVNLRRHCPMTLKSVMVCDISLQKMNIFLYSSWSVCPDQNVNINSLELLLHVE